MDMGTEEADQGGVLVRDNVFDIFLSTAILSDDLGCRVEQQQFRVDMGAEKADKSGAAPPGVRCLFSKTPDLLFVLLPREVRGHVLMPGRRVVPCGMRSASSPPDTRHPTCSSCSCHARCASARRSTC